MGSDHGECGQRTEPADVWQLVFWGVGTGGKEVQETATKARPGTCFGSILAIIAAQRLKGDRHVQPIPPKTKILGLDLVPVIMGTLRMSLPPLASSLIGRRSSLGIQVN